MQQALENKINKIWHNRQKIRKFAYMSKRKSRNYSRHLRRRRGPREFWTVIIVALIVVFIIWGFIALAGISSESYASVRKDPKHIPDLEIAKSGKDLPVIEYTGFKLAFDENRHTPVWVGWELLREESTGDQKRSSHRFWQDDNVYGCPSTKDYSCSGYDRGHMCPAADQKWSKEAMRDCFSLANIVPQDHELNAGAWATLEKKERVWAQRDSALVIVAGPIYTAADTTRIGQTGVAVPSAFFKVMLAPYLDKPRAIGFIYPNTDSPGNMQQYSMSVDEVEKITGLDFFSTLPDELEDEVESKFSFTLWTL